MGIRLVYYKASSIGCKPILDNLEKKFVPDEPAKESLKQRIKNAIDDCLQTSLGNMKNLVTALSQKQIYTVLRQIQKVDCMISPSWTT